MRGGGQIYQVDLIAALFAGYTIVWIATADKQELVLSQSELVLATLNLTLVGEVREPGTATQQYLQRAGVLALAEAGCIPETLGDYLDLSATALSFCLASALPRLTNEYNDALSILEVIRNPLNPLEKGEPCLSSSLTSDYPTYYNEIVEATLLDIGLPDGLVPLGLAYSTPEISWPDPLFGNFPERIPRYIGLEDVDNWEADGDEPPYSCAYQRDRERQLETVFIADDFDGSQQRISLRIQSGTGADLYHIFRSGRPTAESFVSAASPVMLRASSIRLQGDYDVYDPILSARLCLHEEAQARCWVGNGPLIPGGIIILDREGG